MNRNDELIEYKKELEQTPVELEYLARKAIFKAKKHKRRSVLWKTPLVSFCTITVTFILLVNMFPAVALAMSSVPVLKELVRAVAFDPSLKIAVENDYYQIIGDSQTQDDVTVSVDYMILDAGHVSLFFHVDAPVKAGIFHFETLNPDGTPLAACTMFDTMYETGKMEEIKIELPERDFQLPEELTFKITVNKDEDFQEIMTVAIPADEDAPDEYVKPESKGIDYNFTFQLHPDKGFSQTVNAVPIHQWIEIKGQKIYLESLDIYPSQARLYLQCDADNSAVLKGLDIYFKDNKGNIYDARSNGISATYNLDTPDIASLYYESSYFSKADHLTLYIEGISCVDKKILYGEIDYATKTITNLPEGVTVNSMELDGSTLSFELKVISQKPNHCFDVMSSTYGDKDGNEYNFKSWDTSTSPEDNVFYSRHKIVNYQENKYIVNWIYSPTQVLKESVSINIK